VALESLPHGPNADDEKTAVVKAAKCLYPCVIRVKRLWVDGGGGGGGAGDPSLPSNTTRRPENQNLNFRFPITPSLSIFHHCVGKLHYYCMISDIFLLGKSALLPLLLRYVYGSVMCKTLFQIISVSSFSKFRKKQKRAK
jgi:hypothetical protein